MDGEQITLLEPHLESIFEAIFDLGMSYAAPVFLLTDCATVMSAVLVTTAMRPLRH